MALQALALSLAAPLINLVVCGVWIKETPLSTLGTPFIVEGRRTRPKLTQVSMNT